MSVIHADFTIERQYDCSPARTYSAFSDPDLKRSWFAVPESWENAVWELDFRVGGGEINSGEAPDGLVHTFKSRYHEIVPDERIVFAYDLLVDERLTSVSLTTVELFPAEDGTRLLFTEQGAFFDGLDDPAEREHGTGKLLEGLGNLLATGAPPMTLTLHEHPFAAYCWKPLIALYEREVPFERNQIDDEGGRARLAELWPPASIPVLVDDEAGATLAESTVVVEYLDRFGDAPPLVPAEPEAALRARLWDRVIDSHVATPMQRIVADALRPEGSRDPYGVEQARGELGRTYAMLDEHLRDRRWLAGPDFTISECAAAPALFYARILRRWDEENLAELSRYYEALTARPAVARVIEEAQPFREGFPLPWPDYAA